MTCCSYATLSLQCLAIIARANRMFRISSVLAGSGFRYTPVRATGRGLAGELPSCGAVPLPAAPPGDWARLAGASKDAVGTCAGDRRSVSRAGLPAISRLDRTVLHLSPGERQASTEPRYAA